MQTSVVDASVQYRDKACLQ